jgi:hypothetical protein
MVEFLGHVLAKDTDGAAVSAPQTADDSLGWSYLLRLGLSHDGHDTSH